MSPLCPLIAASSNAAEGLQSSSSNEEQSQRSSDYKPSTSEDSMSRSYAERVNKSPEYYKPKLQSASSGEGEGTSATSQSNCKDLVSSCPESSLEAGEVESCSSETWLWRGESKEEEEEEEEENEGCHTPRAAECQIPQLHFCPPAPRKRKPCLSFHFTRQLSGLLVVPDFEAFFPLPKICVRD